MIQGKNNNITALFVKKHSIYKKYLEDCYDITRDALSFPMNKPIIAHPPCRLWGQLRHFSNADQSELWLAIWSITVARLCGGIVEHPERSLLWDYMGCPRPGERDTFKGFTVSVNLSWFGYEATKRTRLYIVGIEPKELPAYPISLNQPTHIISSISKHRYKKTPGKEISKSKRDETPDQMVKYLITVANAILQKQLNK